MISKALGAGREAIDIRGLELCAAVAAEHVTIQTVEQYDHCFFWLHFNLRAVWFSQDNDLLSK
jgi:hypothetical protein